MDGAHVGSIGSVSHNASAVTANSQTVSGHPNLPVGYYTHIQSIHLNRARILQSWWRQTDLLLHRGSIVLFPHSWTYLFIKTVVRFIHTHSASLVQSKNTDSFTESTYSLSNAVQLKNGFFTAYCIITVVHVTVSLEGRKKAPKIVTRFTKEAFMGPPYDIWQTMAKAISATCFGKSKLWHNKEIVR